MMPVTSVIRRPRLRVYNLAVVATSLVAVGCWGEPEPLRSKDPAQARAAIQKKAEYPDRPPGLPKASRPR
jgi:hypothetical protein